MPTESFTKEFILTKKGAKMLADMLKNPNPNPSKIQKPKEPIEYVKKEDIKKFFGLE